MPDYLVIPTADAATDTLGNAKIAYGVSDPATITGLTNGTEYQAHALSTPSDPFTPTASFTEARVQGNGATTLLAGAAMPNATRLLYFAKFEAEDLRRVLWSADDTTSALYADYNGGSGTVVPQMRQFSGMALGPFDVGSAAVDEEIAILMAFDLTGGTGSAIRTAYFWNATNGAWTEQFHVTNETFSGANFPFSTWDAPKIFGKSASTGTEYDGVIGRQALWLDPTTMPDITQASVRDNFLNSSNGNLIAPSVSQAAYGGSGGGLQFDFYTLDHYNLANPDGALAWTKSGSNLVAAA